MHDLGCELVSSGGTAKAIADAGLPVTDTAELTGFPPILGHRVVTLHPRVHGGILADPTDPQHRADMRDHGIEPFDLVVINAYPFGTDPADFEHGGNAGAMDVLDIGGPAMIRAAAKNHAHVGVVVDPADYDEVLDELRSTGRLSDDLRRRLARKAFAFTAAYDAGIVRVVRRRRRSTGPSRCTSRTGGSPLELRYGENPHQAAALYRDGGADAVVGRHDPARRHGAQLPQPLRRRRRLAARPRPRRARPASRRAPSSSTPTRAARPSPTPSPTPTGWPSSATRGRPSAASSPSASRSTRRRSRQMVAAAQADVVIAPGYARRRRRRARGQAEEHPAARGAAADARRAPPPPDHRRPARAGPAPLRRRRGATGGSSPSASRPRPSGPTPSWPCASAAR